MKETLFSIKIDHADPEDKISEDLQFVVSSSENAISCCFYDTALHGLERAKELIARELMFQLSSDDSDHK